MKKSNIALIGLRATGKSRIGNILARQMSMTFVDMDERLTALFGTDIGTWVRDHGWEAFREAESQLLLSLSEDRGQVIATGGGVILKAINREILRNHFFVVWLHASTQTLHARLLQDPKTEANRPPLTDLPPLEEIDRLDRERSPLYRECADLILQTDAAAPEELALSIRSSLADRVPRIRTDPIQAHEI